MKVDTFGMLKFFSRLMFGFHNAIHFVINIRNCGTFLTLTDTAEALNSDKAEQGVQGHSENT